MTVTNTSLSLHYHPFFQEVSITVNSYFDLYFPQKYISVWEADISNVPYTMRYTKKTVCKVYDNRFKYPILTFNKERNTTKRVPKAVMKPCLIHSLWFKPRFLFLLNLSHKITLFWAGILLCQQQHTTAPRCPFTMVPGVWCYAPASTVTDDILVPPRGAVEVTTFTSWSVTRELRCFVTDLRSTKPQSQVRPAIKMSK